MFPQGPWILHSARPEHFKIKVVVVHEVSELLFEYTGHVKNDEDDNLFDYVQK